jgi:hypothetical protein
MTARAGGGSRRDRTLVGLAVGLAVALAPMVGSAQGVEDEARWVLFPDRGPFPQYLADPLRPQGALMLVQALSSDIPESGHGRFLLRLGGTFPIVRRQPPGGGGWQLDFEGGFFGVFDRDHSLDNVGWDGLYGLHLSWRTRSGLALKVGTRHDSAHVGDEYAERTGRRRIGYTREELVVAASRPAGGWELYAEAGYVVDLRPTQEPLRLQVGAQRVGPRRLFGGRSSPYAAGNATFYEERGWRPTTTLQAGLVFPTGRGRSRYRIAAELTHGPSVLGEFRGRDETFLAVGWYFDL